MRKFLVAVVVVVAVAMVAAPAMAADISASGFYRSKAWLSNFFGGSLPVANDEPTNAFVEQRFRVKWSFGNENVKAVWYLESDMIWGDSAGNTGTGAARNVGGALGADKVQTETKNIYIWFKIPDTSVSAQIGMQAQKDAYQGTFYNADVAGIFVDGKYEPISYTIAWARPYEQNRGVWDDATLYQAEVGWAPNKEMQLGFNFYFWQDDTGKTTTIAAPGPLQPFVGTGGPSLETLGANGDLKLYMPGINGTFKAGPVTISGFLYYQNGKLESVSGAVPDTDISAFSADLRADMKVGPGKIFVEGLWLSGSDMSGDNPDYEAPLTFGTYVFSPGGFSSYSRTRMQVLLSSWDTINVSQCLIGCSGGVYGQDLGNGGRGLWHVAAGYSQKFDDKISGEVNVGYLAAVETYASGAAGGALDDGSRDSDMGTEVNAGVAYNIYKGLDTGLYGAYVWVGDFGQVSPSTDLKDIWMGYARINYSF